VNWSHPLGTDQLGPRPLARLMFGGQVSIAVGLAAMLLSLVLGTPSASSRASCGRSTGS
jgi:peptide/nickel transport system permease protein